MLLRMWGYLQNRLQRKQLERHYAGTDYLTAYARHTDLRVEADPREAVGGMWEEIGRLQFTFLVEEGLRPSDRLLDIGCGTLRGGRHLIRHLEPGHYTGFDMSPKAIEAARALVEEEGLVDKSPRIFVNHDGSLRFDALRGEAFDVILAQSVFTHLPPSSIEECLSHVSNVMAEDGRFYFTFSSSAVPERRSQKEYAYPFSFFEDLARLHGLHLDDVSRRYDHPRAQRMVRATRV